MSFADGEGLQQAAHVILQALDPLADARLDFLTIPSGRGRRRVAAVDGGSTIALNARSVGLYAIRAGYVVRGAEGGHQSRITADRARSVTTRSVGTSWTKLKEHYGWGVDVEAPKMDAARLVGQSAECERMLAEFDAARQALHELRRGDALLLDGSLDDEERFSALRDSLLEWAATGGVTVLAVSKDTGLSIGGVLPFTVELEELARNRGVAGPWCADATDALGYADAGFRIFGMQFDARSPAYRVDVVGEPVLDAAALLRALCDDPAYPGYPYPLARVHQQVNFDSGEAVDLRRELEEIVSRRRGQRLAHRLFGKGRDVLQLAN